MHFTSTQYHFSSLQIPKTAVLLLGSGRIRFGFGFGSVSDRTQKYSRIRIGFGSIFSNFSDSDRIWIAFFKIFGFGSDRIHILYIFQIGFGSDWIGFTFHPLYFSANFFQKMRNGTEMKCKWKMKYSFVPIFETKRTQIFYD